MKNIEMKSTENKNTENKNTVMRSKSLYIFAAVLTLLFALMISGCGKKNKDDAQDASETEAVVTKESDASDVETDEQEETDDSDDEAAAGSGDIAYIGLETCNTIHAVDENGKVYASYDKTDIYKQFELTADSMIASYDGDVIFVESTLYDSGKGETTVYACDLTSGEKTAVFRSDADIRSIDPYNGGLYIDIFQQDYETGDRTLEEHVFERGDDKSLTYEETDSPCKDMLSQAAADGYDLMFCSCFNGCSYLGECAKRELDEDNGILLRDNDGGYYLMSETGSYEKIDIIEGNGTVVGREGNYIAYNSYDDDYNVSGLFLYDIAGGTSLALTDYYSYFLGIFGNRVYWNVNYNNEQESQKEYHGFAYDIADDESEELFVMNSLPGYGNEVNFGDPGFSRVKDSAAMILPDDGCLKWKLITGTGNGYDIKDTGLVAFSEVCDGYGTIEEIEDAKYCDDCGSLIFDFTYELLTLDMPYDGIPAINQQLEDFYEETKDGLEYLKEDQSAGYTEVTCEDHQNGMWLYTSDTVISSIELLKDHYISIEIDGYDYSGGAAHGYPLNRNYLFDLNTGERIEIENLYKGSEEELADLVASKAKEMTEEANSKNEYTRFYSDDPDEVYETAKDSFSADMYTRFEQDGVVFAYSPYSIGPYASGYIEILVPYEDLGFSL